MNPEKEIVIKKTDYNDEWWQPVFFCPSCHNEFMVDKPNFCPCCGKKIVGMKCGNVTEYYLDHFGA